MSFLKVLKQETLNQIIGQREGEFKIGQKVQLLTSNQNLNEQLTQLKNEKNIKFALLGIPEDIGPRANCGRGGSDGAYEAVLAKFVNVQSNQYLQGDDILIMGHIDCSDLMEKSKGLNGNDKQQLALLRELCGQIDERVYEVISELQKVGITPVVVGGGHNNSYGMIRGSSQGLGKRINAINCDPHADFRDQEGRHSGNGFSYAKKEGYLQKYFVLGLHESYNNQGILEEFKKDEQNLAFNTFDGLIRNEYNFIEAIKQGIEWVKNEFKVGIEIDLDCIEYMPTSAFTPSGVSSTEIRQYTSLCAQNLDCAYLHLAEGAPKWDANGEGIIGKMGAYIICDFIKARLQRQ
ncbi:hypothetical protein PPERSA_03199 [Pseudocohnilembus persalinus]|uniref:Uncharacterized protein n=1 Tax=Pseudocohnilembus persalinus TaxID=266149 RepID=A0A0V0QE50_PSEPJ|nr:hypothetical protein PPERSA_03199 [Pseudocohnilembus persalinus]|eukprot:KRX00466.1 hypothetical protein PPERSA_03199 [Pseudocohnilembus persalinus]